MTHISPEQFLGGSFMEPYFLDRNDLLQADCIRVTYLNQVEGRYISSQKTNKSQPQKRMEECSHTNDNSYRCSKGGPSLLIPTEWRFSFMKDKEHVAQHKNEKMTSKLNKKRASIAFYEAESPKKNPRKKKEHILARYPKVLIDGSLNTVYCVLD
jgi:hypothetical protein